MGGNKKTLKLFLIVELLAYLMVPVLTLAQEKKEPEPPLQFFWLAGCPYCTQEKVFLQEMQKKYPELKIQDYDASKEENLAQLRELMKQHPGSERYLGSVPLTFIGEDFFVGFNKNIGDKIENSIRKHYQEIGSLQQEEKFSLPVLGQIDPQKWSLGALAVVIGLLDGFNVCSFGALIVILLLVLALKSRKMTFVFGGLFILVVVLSYGLLMFLWHQLFLVLVPWMLLMRLIIGLAAFLGGFYFLKQFLKFKKQGPSCAVGGQKTISSRLQNLQERFKQKNFWLIFGGVATFAALVTLVEFPCSAVFPLVFTGILAKTQLSLAASLFYILIYLLFYMLDEIAVFLTAVFTRKIWMSSGSFMTWSSLLGSVVLFFLAYYYFFVV